VLFLPLLGDAGQEGELPGHRGAVDAEQEGDAPHGHPGAEELENLGVHAAFMLPVWFLKGG
jgi:hypothetical protein